MFTELVKNGRSRTWDWSVGLEMMVKETVIPCELVARSL